MNKLIIFLCVLCSVVAVAGCGKDTNSVTVVEGASKTTLLNPLTVQQFEAPLPIIPVAAPDSTIEPGFEYYKVVAEQTSGYDFGLRKKDGTNFTDPVSGAPIRTTVWGYTVNGIRAGYLGATIEARSTLAGETGKQVKVTYTNDLKDSAGRLLTEHLLVVDPTVLGMGDDMGDDMANSPEIRIVTHLHGGHVAAESDGHPNAWITNNPAGMTGLPADPISGRPARPNGNAVTYTYENDQIANHLWFHDHAMGITRLNVYAGLAANYFLRDSVEDALNIPKGAYEIPLVIQDKSFNEDGSLHYDSNALLDPDGSQQMADGKPVYTSNPEFFGNIITVNGKAWPKLEVEPRKYRFRMLNGSDSRFYNMWLERSDGLPVPAGAITQIGNDGGLLPAAVSIGTSKDDGLLLALAERADVIIDFSLFPAGTSITVRNDAHTPYPNGDDVNPSTTGRIMQFKITKTLIGTDSTVIPAVPRVLPPYDAPNNTRYVDLQETEEDTAFVFDPYSGAIAKRLMILLNGLPFDAPITENIQLNDVEDWVIINNTVDMHPMHLHLVHFEVVEKGSIAPGAYTPADGLARMPTVAPGGLRPSTDPDGIAAEPGSPYTLQPHEFGHKDTVRVPQADENIGSQGYVKIRAKFDLIGTYMWHCHILAHEDHEMMRPFRVQ